MEHIISVKSNDKIIDANTGSFCYMNTSGGSCIDKIDFQDFQYDEISSFYDNKLHININNINNILNSNINLYFIFKYLSRRKNENKSNSY